VCQHLKNQKGEWFRSNIGKGDMKPERFHGRVSPVAKLWHRCPTAVNGNKGIDGGTANGTRVAAHKVCLKPAVVPKTVQMGFVKVHAARSNQVGCAAVERHQKGIAPECFDASPEKRESKARMPLPATLQTKQTKTQNINGVLHLKTFWWRAAAAGASPGNSSSSESCGAMPTRPSAHLTLERTGTHKDNLTVWTSSKKTNQKKRLVLPSHLFPGPPFTGLICREVESR
jgi:hypothetical protein